MGMVLVGELKHKFEECSRLLDMIPIILQGVINVTVKTNTTE